MCNNENLRFLIPAGKRICLFVLVTVLCMAVGGVTVGLITIHGATPARLRVAMVLQDLIMFIMPAIVVAMMVTRTPARFLMIDRKPDAAVVVLVACTLVAAIPAMNCLIEWNKNITLPQSMAGVEQMLREAEENAAAMTDMLMGNGSVAAYLLALMIAAVLAGLSEELYFRGTLQRLLSTVPVGSHVAVWTTAVIFSAVHMQFFGFVPRLLLGAYFGYLAVWTGCIWVPVVAHVLNNAMAASSMWLVMRNGNTALETMGTRPQHLWVAAASVAVTAVLIFLTYRRATKATKKPEL